MPQEMKGLLLEDRWAPVTEEMGFLELGAEQAAQAFASWQRGLPASEGFTVEVLPVLGSLEPVLSRLLPLTSGERQRRYLFIPTRSAWTAYVESQWTGTDAASAMGVMARRLSIRCLRVVAVPHTLRKDGGGRYGAVMLVKDYLRNLGLEPFEEDFYLPPSSCAWLVQKTGPFTTAGREYTLEETRRERVL